MTESMFWKLGQLWDQSWFIPKPKFTPADIPDLSGKVVIVTGGNTGIGKETIKALLPKNAKVYMASRNRSKAEAAIADLEKETGKKAVFLELDLADFASVKKAAETFASQESELHILFNNGGVMVPDFKELTKQGYDMTFGTNVLGHHYFTMLLLPIMLATVRTSAPGTVRVITTASSGSYLYPNADIDYDALKPGKARNKMGNQVQYLHSKFGNTLVARELARRYSSEGIISISLNPGNLRTDIQRTLSKPAYLFLRLVLLLPAHFGAITQLYAGTLPEAAEHNGKFLVPWARVGTLSRAANSPENGSRLWEWLEAQTKNWEETQQASA